MKNLNILWMKCFRASWLHAHNHKVKYYNFLVNLDYSVKLLNCWSISYVCQQTCPLMFLNELYNVSHKTKIDIIHKKFTFLYFSPIPAHSENNCKNFHEIHYVYSYVAICNHCYVCITTQGWRIITLYIHTPYLSWSWTLS